MPTKSHKKNNQSNAEMSIILACLGNYESISTTVAALQQQTIVEKLELLIVALKDSGLEPKHPDFSKFYKVAIVAVDKIESVAKANAAGIRKASALIVVLAEDHAFPHRSWAQALIEAHKQDYAAIGPTIQNANPKTAVSWADFFIGYGPWADPIPAGEHEFLPGHNSSYKRDVLLEYDDNLEDILEAETLLHWELREKGHKLYLEPKAKISHTNFSLLSSWIPAQFLCGRVFAGSRRLTMSKFLRLVYFCGAPLIPFVRFSRILKQFRRVKNNTAPPLSCLPVLFFGLTLDGFGQMLGYAFGTGNAKEKLGHFEFHRTKHISKIDREYISKQNLKQLTGDKIKVGIIGCGRAAGKLHLPALQKMQTVEVILLADVDEKQLNSVADDFGIDERYTDYQKLLQKSQVDVVAVLAPVQFHVPIAIAALDAGKHVFLEKPLALTLEDADKLINHASKSEKKIVIGFNLRKHRLIEQARKMVQDGKLGEIEAIRSSWTSAIRYQQDIPDWRNNSQLGGGALFEIGVHHFDLWRYLLDSEVAQIQAYSKKENGINTTVSLSGKMANGLPVSGFFSEQTSNANEIEILGRKGRLRISIYEFDGLSFDPIMSVPGGMGPRLLKLKEFLLQLPTGIKIAKQGGDFLLTYKNEWEHFVEAIQNDGDVHARLEDGRKALEIVLAARESVESGESVKLL